MLCIVMDYADGGDLSSYLRRRGGRLIDEEIVLDWWGPFFCVYGYVLGSLAYRKVFLVCGVGLVVFDDLSYLLGESHTKTVAVRKKAYRRS